MIYNLRKKFIKICILSFACVLVFLFTIIYAITTLQTNANLDSLCEIIAKNNGVFPAYDENDGFFSERAPFNRGALNRESPFTTRFFTIKFSDTGELVEVNTSSVSNVSREAALSYGRDAISKEKIKGWIDEYRYGIYQTDGEKTLVFISGTTSQSANRAFLCTTLAVFFVISLAVVLMIILISKYAVKPVAESYQKQKQFVTDASHELKTPLTLILTNLDILEAEFGKSEWVDDIREESTSMASLVNSLVTLAKMDEAGPICTKTTFNLSNAVSEMVSLFEPKAAHLGLTMHVEIPEGIFYCGMEEEICQLCRILLDNSIKYCDPGGQIKVHLENGRHPCLLMSNTFAAVSETDLNRLFDRFYRADRARTAGNGQGIGLSIAKAITERHHGKIYARHAANSPMDAIEFVVKLR